jgi:2-oxoglutarate dehydrogenase E2 component (dihydrolipoamide succinyltransferase)
MTTDIIVPTLGESVTEATVAKWFKSPGDAVVLDEPLVELETDKVTLEINAASNGVLAEIAAEAGADVEVGALLGRIADEGAAAPSVPVAVAEEQPVEAVASVAVAAAGGSAPAPAPQPPSVRNLVEERGLDASAIPATGKAGRLTKGDVLAHIGLAPAAEPSPVSPSAAAPVVEPTPAAATEPKPAPAADGREERVRMTRLRQRIAGRLKEAQNTAALLSTFNEVDMSAVMAARARYRDDFEKRHGVRLGFMSFFVKAALVALREIPAVNAEIDGDELVYKNHYDIGVAVGTEQGLVVPVLRDADQLDFGEIEKGVAELGRKARDGALTMEELTGGTFTITNGGVYGSLLSTPILNPPQSGILGMHKIEERPVARGGEVVVRPMMYLALTYDHRVIDGREAVTFLVRIKECIENPERIMLGV